MAQDNLVSIGDRTREEQREITTKGGIASGKARRKKRDLREAVLAALESDLKTKDGTMQPATERIAAAVIVKAANGDITAFKTLFEMLYGSKANVDFTSSDGSMRMPAEIALKLVRPDETNTGS